jgi:hypothetical protein
MRKFDVIYHGDEIKIGKRMKIVKKAYEAL